MADRDSQIRTLPQAYDAEQAVLGAILLDERSMDTVVEILEEESFYHGQHKKIFNAMLYLYDKHEAIDLVTVGAELERRGDLEIIGGRSYLADLSTSVATTANINHYSEIVLEKANLRDLMLASTGIIESCYQQTEEVEELLDRAETAVFKIAERKLRESAVPIRQLLPHTFEAIEQLQKGGGKANALGTGFDKIDEITSSGFKNGELIVIAGRPSMGKTSLALSIALYAAVECNKGIGIFSLETGREQVALRLLCSQARVSAHHIQIGKVRDQDWPRLSAAADPLSKAPVYIDDSSLLSILDLRAKARRLKRKYDISLVIVDYLQLMRGHKRAESRQQEITMISQGLKALAKDLNIPVLALSQLSRKTEDRPDKKPELSDLRESGSIEQDADIVMAVYRPEFYGIERFKDGMTTEGNAEIRVLKNRNGPTGDVRLSFRKDYAHFVPLDPYHMEPADKPGAPF